MLNSPFAPQGLAGQPLAAPPPRPAPEQVSGPAQEGPSEFTKMFKAQAAAPPEAAPKAAKKTPFRPPIQKKKKNLLPWILIGVAVLLLLALLIYFAVK